ncbi:MULTISPECIES: serine/threonine-protein kinase [unclassified Streptomyces]|uniref:serine/threonine-protein kinase n=1 Tax=unclassified Streptomyces TaxID=2593676 RepID=UPI0036FF5A23
MTGGTGGGEPGAGVLLNGRYRLLGPRGAGAQGAVFTAYDERLRREVAVKTLTATDGEARGRFRREVHTLAALRHDHVVTVFDSGEHAGVPFAVLELVEGESLAGVLTRQERLPLARVLELGRQVADGLAAAHAHGIVHRDIKPGNILVTASGRAKICDFGLVTAWMPDAARLTVRGGPGPCTPGYASPEQATPGRPVEAPSDVFSLGATLYALLAGGSPFRGADPLDTLARTRDEEPPPVTRYRPEVPGSCAALLAAVLAKEPARRPSAGSVRSRLATELDRLRPHAAYSPTARGGPPEQGAEPVPGPMPTPVPTPVPVPVTAPAVTPVVTPVAAGLDDVTQAAPGAVPPGRGRGGGEPDRTELWRRLEAAEEELRAGRAQEADDAFRALAVELHASGHHAHPAMHAARLGRVRALARLGRRAAAERRLARLRVQAEQLAADHPLRRAVAALTLRRARGGSPGGPR